MNKDKYVVVTGGAGFIGSGIIKELNNRNIQKIVVVDHLGKDDKWKNLVKKQFTEIIEIDQFPSWLVGREEEIETIFHLGACSDTTEQNASYLLENNYHYSIQLAEYALKNDIKFIYASSAATYGDGEKGFNDDHEQLDELEPLNMYGYSKHLFDLWLKRQGALNNVVGLKYFNVYGPNECHKGRMASVIKKFLPDALYKNQISLFKSTEPSLFKDGGQKRDFIYVKDVARITVDFMESDQHGIYNIGRGVAVEWNEMAEAIFLAIDKKPVIHYVEMPEDLKGKYQNYTCADIRKLKHVFKNKLTFQTVCESVEDYIKNHLIPEKKW